MQIIVWKPNFFKSKKFIKYALSLKPVANVPPTDPPFLINDVLSHIFNLLQVKEYVIKASLVCRSFYHISRPHVQNLPKLTLFVLQNETILQSIIKYFKYQDWMNFSITCKSIFKTMNNPNISYKMPIPPIKITLHNWGPVTIMHSNGYCYDWDFRGSAGLVYST
jgi:hypothetical protein